MTAQRLSAAIVQDYLHRIRSGALVPGEAVPAEVSLAKTYGVSRGVVREALQALAAKGFVVTRKGSGSVVAPRQEWQVLDTALLAANTGAVLQEAREELEPTLAALAARRATAAQVDELERTLEGGGTFHDAIARASGNPVLSSMYEMLCGLDHGSRTESAEADRVRWHRQVLEAVRSGDPVNASSAMYLHVRRESPQL